jgi:tetraacyldisaccharide 4'-kinase
VLDDAFQSWRVPRHTDIVLLDVRAPLDGGALLPAGRLRETADALGRADAIVFNGASSADEIAGARDRVQRYLRGGVPVAGMARSLTLVNTGGRAKPPPPSALVVCAIARPDAFRQSLEKAGVNVTALMSWRDHHRYTTADAARIIERARRDGLPVVTTEKDWMKLRVLELPPEVWIARLEVTLLGDPLPV